MIRGFQEVSLIDYPGHIAAVIFTGGCMFRCPFCHNASLAKNAKHLPFFSFDQVIETLISRKSVIEAVVISGGEPTIHPQLPELIHKIKELGFKVKLDTAGVNPDMLEKVLPHLDYVAMDIKHSFKKYSSAIGISVTLDKIKKSIVLIQQSGVPYEFRTTVVPGLHEVSDFEAIGKELENSEQIYIQQFVPSNDMVDMSYAEKKSPSMEILENIQRILEKYVKHVDIRAYV